MQLDDKALARWSYRVRSTAKFTCDICGYHHVWWRRKRQLHAHHLNDKSTHPDQAYALTNGKCMCGTCHITKFHGNHMGGAHKSCTRADYIRFKKKYTGNGWLNFLIISIGLYLVAVILL